jgi:hypothetical protein
MMERTRAGTALRLFTVCCGIQIILIGEAAAYVDPGTTGLLSQILYVLFYGALGVFFYFLRYIKQYLTNAKDFVAKFFAGRE